MRLDDLTQLPGQGLGGDWLLKERDARVEHLSNNKELDFFLVPFLSGKLPQQMKVNAADLIRQLLSKSAESTGYDLTLDNLKVHSMQVSGDALVVDFDGNMSVH